MRMSETDSLGNDIISVPSWARVWRPTVSMMMRLSPRSMLNRDEDFGCTRELSRWDGYYDPWFYDYYGYGPYYWRSRMWGWHNPWRYGYYAGWYDPWFDPWYDPWYYGYAAGMVAGTTLGIMAGVAITILGIGAVRYTDM